jgi:hypothetical protein
VQAAGRKPGSANRKTRELADQAATDGLLPLEYILSVVRDPSVDSERRDRMAIAAAPYCHPRLNAIAAKVDTTVQAEQRLTREELDARAEAIIGDAFREYQPPGPQEVRINGPVIEPRNSPSQDGDRSEPVPEADPPAPRDFARPSSFEVVSGPARRSIRRRPRPVGSGWAG